MSTLIRVTTSYYCAGMIERNGYIVTAAPILKWTIGMPYAKAIASVCKKKGVKIEQFKLEG